MKLRAESVTEESGQTDGAVFIHPMMCFGIAPTDTFVAEASSNLPSLHSPQTTAEAVLVYIPIPHHLARTTASRGQKVTSIEVYFDLDVAGTAATLKLYKTTLAADATIPSAAEVTTTCSHTEAELYAADEQKAVLTITTPAFLADNEAYHVELSITKATTSDLKFFGALVNFTRAL
jgi:hypothetical protein